MPRPYQLQDTQRVQLASDYLLKKMTSENWRPDLMLDAPGDRDLEPALEQMMTQGWISIQSPKDADAFYIPTEAGKARAFHFQTRYSEFLRVFDIFCAVDLKAGEFALASYFDLSESAWSKFIEEPRWDDLRVAVAEYKGIDPIEVVFLSFLQEKRFGSDQPGWQFDLLLGDTWKDVVAVCNNSISVDQLGYEDEQGKVSGEDVIRDVILQGFKILKHLAQEEKRLVVEGKIRLAGKPKPVLESFWDPYLTDPKYKGSLG